jgi:transmembrane sensor
MESAADEPQRDDALREQAAAWLARLRGGSAEDHAAFEAWYQADARHAAAYDAVLDSWDIAGRAGETSFANQIPARAPGRRWCYAVAAIAATVAVVVLAFSAYGAGGTGVEPFAPMKFASAAGEIRTEVLADGSRVTLDPASLLLVAYSPTERRVELTRGRARFTVAHDPVHPFIVATRAGEVIAHGTVFDVACDGHKTTVSLIEGSIEVRPRAPGDRLRSARMLSPGQRVTLSGGEVSLPSSSSDQPAPDRGARMLSFEDAPLDTVIAAANRASPDRIVLADPNLARLRFTGSFKTGGTAQLARMLAAAFELVLSRPDDHTFLLSPARSRQPGSK